MLIRLMWPSNKYPLTLCRAIQLFCAPLSLSRHAHRPQDVALSEIADFEPMLRTLLEFFVNSPTTERTGAGLAEVHLGACRGILHHGTEANKCSIAVRVGRVAHIQHWYLRKFERASGYTSANEHTCWNAPSVPKTREKCSITYLLNSA